MRSGTLRVLAGVVLMMSALCVWWRPVSAQTMTTDPVTSVSIELETVIVGLPEQVYDAITGDVSEWWDHRFSDEPHAFILEPKVGGRFIELFDESGNGVVHAEVIYASRGERIRFEGPLGFSGQPVQIVATYEFKEVEPDSTRLTVLVRAAGPLDENETKALRRVWHHFILDRFKPHYEGRRRTTAN